MKHKRKKILFRICVLMPLLGMTACRTTHQAQLTSEPGDVFVQPVNVNVALITSAKGGGHAEAVATELESDLESALVDAGYRLKSSSPQLSVHVEVEVEELDVTGNYYTLDAEGRMRVVGDYDPEKPVLASDVVSAPIPRTLGKAKAQREASRLLAEGLADRMGRAVKKEAGNLVAQTITVKLNLLRLEDARAYPGTFVREVSELDGVLRCELIRNNLETRTSVYEVVHLKDAFPAGFETALAAIPALNIR